MDKTLIHIKATIKKKEKNRERENSERKQTNLIKRQINKCENENNSFKSLTHKSIKLNKGVGCDWSAVENCGIVKRRIAHLNDCKQ